MPHQLGHQAGVDAAGGGPMAIPVERLRSARPGLDRHIHRHVGWPQVEGIGALDVAPHDRDIRDAAEVQASPRPTRGAEEQPVDEWNEGGALAAGRHVARSEVRHHGETGPLGDDRRLGELERGRPAVRGGRARVMPGRLAVRADEVDGEPGAPGGLDDIEGGARECLAERVVDQEELPRRRLPEGEDPRAQLRLVRAGAEVDEARVRRRPRPAQLDEGRVDPIDARPRDEPDHSPGLDAAQREEAREGIKSHGSSAPGRPGGRPRARPGALAPLGHRHPAGR